MFQIQSFSEFRKKFYSLMTAGLNGVKLLPPVSGGKCNIGGGGSSYVAYLWTRVLAWGNNKRKKTLRGWWWRSHIKSFHQLPLFCLIVSVHCLAIPFQATWRAISSLSGWKPEKSKWPPILPEPHILKGSKPSPGCWVLLHEISILRAGFVGRIQISLARNRNLLSSPGDRIILQTSPC